ncbi:MAG: hypothetical protein WD894_01605 [Pirellulales bacterium]
MARPRAFRYEKRSQRPLALGHFLWRWLAHFLIVVAIGTLSLAIGMAGYMYFERLSWVDAFLNSAMLLGGMGPVNMPVTQAGKLFAGCYALFAGVVFLVGASILVAPVIHRILHRWHWNDET